MNHLVMNKKSANLFHFLILPGLAFVPVIFALYTVLIPAQTALAQEPTPVVVTDDQVNAIAKQMYCPVCENTPLDVCPTTACAQWRELIREKLAAGWNEKQIKDYFVEQYGVRILGAPPARGFNWLVYLVPPLAILAGVIILIRFFRSGKRPTTAQEAPPPQPPADDDYTRQLEEELRKY